MEVYGSRYVVTLLVIQVCCIRRYSYTASVSLDVIGCPHNQQEHIITSIRLPHQTRELYSKIVVTKLYTHKHKWQDGGQPKAGVVSNNSYCAITAPQTDSFEFDGMCSDDNDGTITWNYDRVI